MSYPEDKMTSKPPGDEPSSGSPIPKRRGKYDDEVEESGGSNAANIIGIVMLVGIVVLGGLFWTSLQRSKVEEKQKTDAAAKVAAETARADSISKAEQERIYAARADSLKAEEAKHPKPKTAATTATPTAQAQPGGQQATPPPPATKYGIDAGSFLSQDRAAAELTKLQGSTSLSGRVVPKSEDGGTSYHVVIGEFASRKDADKKAGELIVAATIHEATVTKLK